MKSFPCKHFVKVYKKDKLEKDYGAMFAPKIAKLFHSYGLEPPSHLKGFENHPMYKMDK